MLMLYEQHLLKVYINVDISAYLHKYVCIVHYGKVIYKQKKRKRKKNRKALLALN